MPTVYAQISNSAHDLSVGTSQKSNKEPLLWTDTAQAIGSIAAAIITTLGFGFVIYQIRQTNRNMHSSTFNAIFSQSTEITRFFIENPGLRPFFYDNVDVSDTDERYGKLIALAELVADAFQHILLQSDNFPESVKPKWIAYMKYIYDNSPVLRRHLRSHGTWYTNEFMSMFVNKV
jgi:hypothetical protein